MMEIFLLIISIIFIGVGILAPFILIRCFTQVGAGAKWIVGIFVLETVLYILPPLPIGINIYPQDLVFLLLGGCAVGRFLLIPERNRWTSLWMILGAVWFGLFVVGLVKFKTVAGVEYRPFFYFWSGTAYFASFRYTKEQEQLVWSALKWGAISLLLIACYRWVADAAGISSVNWGLLVGASPFRVLNSAHAHFLASVLILLLVRYGNKKSDWTEDYLAVALVLTILMLQHRTVWVLIVFAIALILVREPSIRKKMALPILVAFMGVGFIVVIGFASGLLDSVYASLQRSVEEAFKGEGSTLSWRMQSWQELLRIWVGDGFSVNAVGYPFGNGWERYVADLKHSTNYSPHSFYVQLLLRGGIVGFGLFFATYLMAVFRLKNSRISFFVFDTSALLAILFGQLIYYATYGPGSMQGVFLGVTFSLLGASNNSEAMGRGVTGSTVN